MIFKFQKEYYKLMKYYNNSKINVSLDYLNKAFLKYVEQELGIKDSYLNLIKNGALLLKELKATNPYLAAALFNHLLWGGYFSLNKELLYNPNRILLPFFNGAVVTTGNAACLEFSELEARILTELGIKAYTIACFYNNNDEGITIISDIKRKITLSSKPNNSCDTKETITEENKFNHAVTLIDGNEGYFLADSTDMQFLNIKNLIYGKLIFDKSYLTLDYNSLPIRSDIKTSELVELIKKIKVQSNKKILTPKKTIEIFEQAKYIFNENKKIIDDYYADTNQYIEDVSKKLIKHYNKK